MNKYQRNEMTLLPSPPLLKSESSDEFAAIRNALAREIEPHGIIENMYVADIGNILWEILRLRRCKTVIINIGFRSALRNLLVQVLSRVDDLDDSVGTAAEDLSLRWFNEPEAKNQVAEILARIGLDVSAIEAEAIKISSVDLERLDRILMSLERRRDKALRSIREYRDPSASRLRKNANPIIEANNVLDPKGSPDECSSAA